MQDIEYEIVPKKRFGFGLTELWAHKELLYSFSWRDIKVKYKQTALGFLWAILQPTALMIIFTYALGNYIKANSNLSIDYSVFALSGLLLWGVFSSGVSGAGNSMVSNAEIIKKIYFPRLIIPISSVIVALFDFLMAFPVFCGILLFKHTWFNIHALLYIPAALLLAAFSTLGIGTGLSALNLKYRDFKYMMPFMIQALMFLSPVVYPISERDSGWMHYLMALNPMKLPLDLLRMSISGYAGGCSLWMISSASSFVFFILGFYYFRKTENYFSDIA
jgi:lipopolysaccharide transport system permease protein